MARVDSINEVMLAELASHGFEPTRENRLAFLQGLKAAWVEETWDDCYEKSRWVLAVTLEIVSLTTSKED